MDLLVCSQLELDFGTDRQEVSEELRNAASNVVAFVNSGSRDTTKLAANKTDRVIYQSIVDRFYESIKKPTNVS